MSSTAHTIKKAPTRGSERRGDENRHSVATIAGFAASLGVSARSLERIGAKRNGTAWTFPERDSNGEIIGTAKRLDEPITLDGKLTNKLFGKGGHRGLTLDWPLSHYAGLSPDDPILIVEGQSDTASGLAAGFTTIGRPSATGGLNHLLPLLKGRHVLIVGENDDEDRAGEDANRPGKTGAEKTADGLAAPGCCASVRIIYPPAGVKDLREWVADHGADRAEIMATAHAVEPWEPQAAATPGTGPVTIRLADVQAEPVSWLWPDRIALGKLTLLAGDPGLGKSFATLDMAARVSTGCGWPDDPGQRYEPGGVVLLSAEDDVADTIRPRLDAAAADCTRIVALQAIRHTDPETGAVIESSFSLETDIIHLERAIIDTPDCRLVVIDPISAYVGKTDSHRDAAVRGLLAPLSDLAAKHDIAVVAVTHLRKGEGAAIYRAMGSLAFVAAARAAFAVAKDKDDSTGKRRLFLPVKNNIGNDRSGLAFELRGIMGSVGQTAQVAWEAGEVEVDADGALSAPHGTPGPEPEERTSAEAWLRQALAGVCRQAADVIDEGTNGEGFSKTTITRARQKLGVKTKKVGFKHAIWWWWLPAHEESTEESTPLVSNNLDSSREPGFFDVTAQKRGFQKAEETKFTEESKFQETGYEPGFYGSNNGSARLQPAHDDEDWGEI